MPRSTLADRIRLTPEKQRFLKKNLRPILIWPLVCVIFGILLYMLLTSVLSGMRRNLEDNARVEARLLALSYARQVARTVGELDRMTALLQSSWKQADGNFRLENFRDSRFVDPDVAAITLLDHRGIAVSSTLPATLGKSGSGREYFTFHRTSPSRDLHIGTPVAGSVSGKEIVTFSRRLSFPDGRFGGVVLASTTAPFLAEVADGPILGRTGIFALIGQDRVLRAAKVGRRVESLLHPRLISTDLLDIASLARTRTSLSGNWFADRKPRYLALEPVDGYPLYAVVGLGQEEVLAPLQAAKENYLEIGLGGGLVLILFAVVACIMSTRLAWRQYREETIRRTYRVATEGANEGFYMWLPIYGPRGDVVDYELEDCNEKGAELYGRRREEILGSRFTGLYSGALAQQLLELASKVMETGFHEDEFKTVDSSVAKPAWIYRRFVRTGEGIAVTLRDISERKQREQETSRLAEHDALTGLPNRHWLGAYLPGALERAAAENRSVAILFADLDAFKNVNDSWGHSAGDILLRAAAERMGGVLGADDKIARFGGDEFVVLVEANADEGAVTEIANRIHAVLHAPFQLQGRAFAIGASVGISLFPRDGADAETLIRNADIAMYAAKSEAKGSYRFFDANLFSRMQHRLETERALAQAVEECRFVVHYQPRVNASDGTLTGCEALVRWAHPARGLVYPGEFIALAEECGLILRLGEQVLDQVCRQLVEWRARGLPVVPVSVNVSAKQFNEGGVAALFASYLRRYDLPSSLINVELTESATANNPQQLFEELAALHALGISVHLDDFGTGYSSLATLHRLDVDVLKVDRAFTAALGSSEEGEVFFRAIISMAKSLGMGVVAEGVERVAQLQVLQQLGCDEIQGYLVAKPLAPEELQAFCTREESGLFERRAVARMPGRA